MSNFFLILMGFFIIVANVIGFISYKKKKNLYFAAFTILLLAVSFGGIGGVLALLLFVMLFQYFMDCK